MSAHTPEKPTDITIPSTSLWAKLPMLGGVLAVVGLGATLGAAAGHDKARAMFSYLWAYEVFLTIALGALGWLVIDHAVRSSWSISVRRIAETVAATLPLFGLLLLPILTLGLHDLYPWTHESDPVLERKRWFLTEGFFFGRAFLYVAVWAVLGTLLYRWSTRQDALGSDTATRDALTRRAQAIAPVGILLYALTSSFQAVDWVMSLQPHWYSTIFGVYFFAVSMVSFFSFMALVAMGLQKAGVLKTAITSEHFHDLGKFVFGYTVFWAYIAFSQFMLIWYANIPEETVFYMARLEGGWEHLSYALPLAHFFVPFLYLLSRHVKRSRLGLGLGAAWMLLMHLVDLYWIILPNFGAHGEGAHGSHFAVSWTDATALIGIGGAFMAAFGYFLTRNKVACVNDPRFSEALAHENY